MEKWRWWKKIW